MGLQWPNEPIDIFIVGSDQIVWSDFPPGVLWRRLWTSDGLALVATLCTQPGLARQLSNLGKTTVGRKTSTPPVYRPSAMERNFEALLRCLPSGPCTIGRLQSVWLLNREMSPFHWYSVDYNLSCPRPLLPPHYQFHATCTRWELHQEPQVEDL